MCIDDVRKNRKLIEHKCDTKDCRKISKRQSFEPKLGIGHWQNAYCTHTGVGHLRNRGKKHFESRKVPLCVNTHTGYVYYSHGGPPSPHLIVQ